MEAKQMKEANHNESSFHHFSSLKSIDFFILTIMPFFIQVTIQVSHKLSKLQDRNIHVSVFPPI